MGSCPRIFERERRHSVVSQKPLRKKFVLFMKDKKLMT